MLLRKLVQKRTERKKGPCFYTGEFIEVGLLRCPGSSLNTQRLCELYTGPRLYGGCCSRTHIHTHGTWGRLGRRNDLVATILLVQYLHGEKVHECVRISSPRFFRKRRRGSSGEGGDSTPPNPTKTEGTSWAHNECWVRLLLLKVWSRDASLTALTVVKQLQGKVVTELRRTRTSERREKLNETK